MGEALRQYDREVMAALRGLSGDHLTSGERVALARGTTLTPPASAADIAALEQRIGRALSPSYRALLETSDGMIFEGASNQVVLLRATEVTPLTPQAYPGLEAWLTMPDVAVPLVPEAGGPLPGSALRRAWLISSAEDGDAYFIFPDLATPDGEWPVWFMGPGNPGAYGYASLRAMFERERGTALRALAARR